MFQFTGFPPYRYVFAARYTRSARMGFPIQIPADHCPFAAPHRFSQLTASFFGSHCQGIRPALFVYLTKLDPLTGIQLRPLHRFTNCCCSPWLPYPIALGYLRHLFYFFVACSSFFAVHSFLPVLPSDVYLGFLWLYAIISFFIDQFPVFGFQGALLAALLFIR
jgi:hypothetical protein